MRKIATSVFAFSLCSLTGCGRNLPPHPETGKDITFPKTYPSPCLEKDPWAEELPEVSSSSSSS